MITKKVNRIAIYVVITTILLSACASGVPTSNSTTTSTGVAELDKIIDIVLRGDTDELKSVIRFTQARCTLADGLGGPPKCLENEPEGTVVEVLPILDSEGHFMRKAELESWNGLDVSELFAVYEARTPIFVDENYPLGQYAIVFVRNDKNTSVTLRVEQGNIVRLDYGYTYPPTIREDEVVRYLITPINVSP